MKESYVILGNGIAALSAIDAIREIDKEGDLYLFGDENRLPYNRISLSKGLLGTLDEEKIMLRKKTWYEENQVKHSLNGEVKEIDLQQQQIKTVLGKTIPYTKLLIATGARNIQPPLEGISNKGVSSLRTYDDALDILSVTHDMKQIVNIGGGIQGLEVAWNLSKLGKKVIIAELMDRLMPRQLDEIASNILHTAIEKTSIQVLLQTQIQEIQGEEQVTGVLSKTGQSYPCDGVVYSIGIKPNIDLFLNTELLVRKGILVDDHMRTNLPNVYAAGDVTEFNGTLYGLWNFAISQGKVAGSNMVGNEQIFEHMVPVTTLSAFDMNLFSMGIVEDTKATLLLVEQKEDHLYNKVFINDGKVIGAIVIGNTKSSPLLKAAIEKEIDLSNLDLKNISIEDLLQKIKENNR